MLLEKIILSLDRNAIYCGLFDLKVFISLKVFSAVCYRISCIFSKNSKVDILTFSTSECDCIWR